MSATSKFFNCLGSTLSTLIAETGRAAGNVIESSVHLVSVPLTVLGDSVETGVKQSRRSLHKKAGRQQAQVES